MDLLIFVLLVLSGLAAVIFLIRDSLSFSYGSLIYYINLVLYFITSSLGAIKRFNSSNFEAYFSSQIDDDYTGAVVGYYLGNTISWQIIFSLLVSIFLFFLYSYFVYAKNKATCFSIFDKILYLIMALYMIFYGFNAIAEIQELQSYGFFTSIVANINFGIIVILFLLETYKGLFHKSNKTH